MNGFDLNHYLEQFGNEKRDRNIRHARIAGTVAFGLYAIVLACLVTRVL